MTFSCPDATAPELAAIAARFGYDGVELRVGQGRHGVGYDTDAQTLRQVRAAFEDQGVAVSCLATSVSFAYDADAGVAECEQAVRTAAAVGAPRIRLFGGFLKDEADRPMARKNVLDGLRRAAPTAEKYQVNLCLELHDSWANPYVTGPVVAELDHPRVKINWDIMHPVLECGVSVADSFAPIARYIDHVHIHDGLIDDDGRFIFLPIGTSKVDHRPAVQALLGIGYAGYLSGEWIDRSEPYEAYLPQDLATMRAYERACAK